MSEPLATPVPGFTLIGWTEDLKQTIDLLLSHAFVSDYSHSTVCPGSITSFQHLLLRHQNSPAGLASAAQDMFQQYIQRYIPDARVQVDYKLDDNYLPEVGNYILKITISAYRNGETINLAESIDVEGGKFRRVAELNNG